MSKFREGDEVRVTKVNVWVPIGDTCVVTETIGDAVRGSWTSTNNYFVRNQDVELVKEQRESYQNLTPKAGDTFTVLKDMENFHDPEIVKGDIITMVSSSKDIRGLCINGRKNYCTTEYLKPFYVPVRNLAAACSYSCYTTNGLDMWAKEPIKQSIKTKMTNFIKKLTQSTDDRVQEQAGLIDSCGDLTSDGNRALIALIYQDYKPKMVELATKIVAESKE